MLDHITTNDCHQATLAMLFFIKILGSYCILNLRTKEGKCIQLKSPQCDEILLRKHALFILKRFPRSFPIIFLFLLMCLYKRKERDLLIINYF